MLDRSFLKVDGYVGIKQRPFCPFCGTVLVPSRLQCVDGSGWMMGWVCSCTAKERDSRDDVGSELIVYSIEVEDVTDQDS